MSTSFLHLARPLPWPTDDVIQHLGLPRPRASANMAVLVGRPWLRALRAGVLLLTVLQVAHWVGWIGAAVPADVDVAASGAHVPSADGNDAPVRQPRGGLWGTQAQPVGRLRPAPDRPERMERRSAPRRPFRERRTPHLPPKERADGRFADPNSPRMTPTFIIAGEFLATGHLAASQSVPAHAHPDSFLDLAAWVRVRRQAAKSVGRRPCTSTFWSTRRSSPWRL